MIGKSRPWEELRDHFRSLQLEPGVVVHVLDLETLIAVKEELGFRKDVAVLPVLRQALKEWRSVYTGFAQMKNIDLNNIPSFDELPVGKTLPPTAPGASSAIMTLRLSELLTPAGVVEAAGLVRTGKVFRLDAKIGFAKPPLFGRASVVHTVSPLGPAANNDLLDRYNTQEGSQWDGLGHVGHVRHGLFYNGVTVEETRSGNATLGIHHWADKFVGRGVLIDALGPAKRGRPVNPLAKDVYTLEELKLSRIAGHGAQARHGSSRAHGLDGVLRKPVRR